MRFVVKIARLSAIIGGVVLMALALLMTVSIIGGTIAKLGNASWLEALSSSAAEAITGTGIRTIPGMYEIIRIGVAFAIFSFLPLASIMRSHAVVDVFTNYLPPRLNQALITFWEIVFCVILILITWRLFYGMERAMSTGTIYQELKVPEWWPYLIAFVQMIIASIVGAFTAFAQGAKLLTGQDILPDTQGGVH